MARPVARRSPLGFRFSAWLASRCPYGALVWAAHAGGYLHYWLSPQKRENRVENLSAVTVAPDHPPWRAFQTHALNVLELLRASRGDAVEILGRVTLIGEHHITSALSGGKGLILTTLHSGNWELAGLMLAQRGHPVTTIAGEQLRPGWSEEVKALKARFGIRVVSIRGPLRTLYDDLRANRAVVLHIDGDLFTGGHDVPFLGKTVKAPRGPAHLSRYLGSPVAFAYCRRTPQRTLEVIVEQPSAPPGSPEEERLLTRALMTRVEKCVLEDPGEWCIFRKLSNTDERA